MAMLYVQVVSLNGLSSLRTEQALLRVYGGTSQICKPQEAATLHKTFSRVQESDNKQLLFQPI